MQLITKVFFDFFRIREVLLDILCTKKSDFQAKT